MKRPHSSAQAGAETPASRPRAPFVHLRINAAVAGVYALATAVWVVAGTELPGGRWLAVHLFTLGVVTNVVLAFSRHFSTTLTRSPAPTPRWPVAVVNAGVVGVLVGMVAGSVAAVAVGSTVVTAVVLASWWDLRRMRRQALDARFAWVVRTYERAHGAFVHGALLGALLGTGVLSGAWFGGARLAHLHVNVLGWGGLTLLATLVFFAPTVLRVRIEQGADARAARWLPRGATALTVAVVCLLLTAVGGAAGVALRLAAAAGLVVYATAAAVVCLPVLRVARAANPSASSNLLVAACCWLLTALAADVVVVATASWELLDAVGVAVLAGALAQGIVGALGYVAPMLTGTSPQQRSRIRTLVEGGARLRPLLANAGVGMAVLAAALGVRAGDAGAALAWLGWGLLAGTSVLQLTAALAHRPDRPAEVA